MAKIKTIYVCQNCGFESSKWMGKCNNCGEWNSFQETIRENSPRILSSNGTLNAPIPINEVPMETAERLDSKNTELNRVLGGGIVPGSLILIGGEPGIGKSTLLLQIIQYNEDLKVLYVSGEESLQQIKMRSERLGKTNELVFLTNETLVERIVEMGKTLKPDMLVVDSIQTIHSDKLESAVGTVSQIRDCTHLLQQYAKQQGVAVFIVGHITKEGSLAGPKILEHIVDTVLTFEGEKNYDFRILRTNKNRFGATSEIGIYKMTSSGLSIVENPSGVFVNSKSVQNSGNAITAILEGGRTLLVEVQALVTNAVYSAPQRIVNGYESRRLNMLLAVLEKRCGYFFGQKDVYLNIAGGVKIVDPAADLAIVCALVSSYVDKTLNAKFCFAGEVGLSGEIRPINRMEERLNEVKKMGYEQFYISALHKTTTNPLLNLQATVKELIGNLFVNVAI